MIPWFLLAGIVYTLIYLLAHWVRQQVILFRRDLRQRELEVEDDRWLRPNSPPDD